MQILYSESYNQKCKFYISNFTIHNTNLNFGLSIMQILSYIIHNANVSSFNGLHNCAFNVASLKTPSKNTTRT